MIFCENRHPVFKIMHHCFGAPAAPDPGPRGSFRFAMHFLRKASRAAPCSLWSSAPNLHVAIFCFASTAKQGAAETETNRAAATSAQRDMPKPPELFPGLFLARFMA